MPLTSPKKPGTKTRNLGHPPSRFTPSGTNLLATRPVRASIKVLQQKSGPTLSKTERVGHPPGSRGEHISSIGLAGVGRRGSVWGQVARKKEGCRASGARWICLRRNPSAYALR